MVRVYDNWDRLVRATVRRERFRLSALRTPSDLSLASSSSSSFDFSVHQSDRLNFDFNVQSPNLRIFSFSELKVATRNFRNYPVLGEVGFGKFYKGWIDESSSSKGGSGSVIAVKMWNCESMQAFEEFQSQMNIHGWLNHPNIVKLLGYCWEENKLLLVYEFMQKANLGYHIFRGDPTPQPLPWDIRLKILIGVAKGLAFLHASERPVIHRHIKPSNILLDGSYNARISDFGLAMIGPTDGRSCDTHVMGTYGYAAPEYMATGQLYVKSDVYGFGVVLVEMLTSLRAIDTNRTSEQVNLVEWIKPRLSHRRKLKHLMDTRLEGKYPLEAAVQIARLSLMCLGPEPEPRPSMQEVVDTLERIESANGIPKEPRMN